MEVTTEIKMNFTFIGLGNVGLVNAVLLASFYHNVIAYDTDKNKIEMLKSGVSTSEEPNLQALLSEAKKYLRFTSNAKDAIRPNNIIVICVDTPIDENGKRDMSHFNKALEDIALNANQDSHIIIKSTVPVGTNKMTMEYLKNNSKFKFNVISMPEFLSLGNAVYDTINPYRLVFGVNNKEAIEFAQSIAPVFLTKKVPVLITSPENAELIKLSSDAFIATKISFANSLASICDELGCDIDRVTLGMSLDPRIGNSFLKPGIGFGGELINNVDIKNWVIDKDNLEFDILDKASLTNDKQSDRFLEMIYNNIRSFNKINVGILGVSYKGGTDSVVHSPALKIIRHILDHNGEVYLFDPLAMDAASKKLSRYTHVHYVDYVSDAIKGMDVVLILSDHTEFKSLTKDDFINNMKKPIVFDGRNIFKKKDMVGVSYHSLGRQK